MLTGVDHHWLAYARGPSSSNASRETTIGNAQPERTLTDKASRFAGKARDSFCHRHIATEVARWATRHERERARLGDLNTRHNLGDGLHHALEGAGIARRVVLLDAHERATRLRLATALPNSYAIGTSSERMRDHSVGVQHHHWFVARSPGDHHRPMRTPQHRNPGHDNTRYRYPVGHRATTG